jgi:hypothetical protein
MHGRPSCPTLFIPPSLLSTHNSRHREIDADLRCPKLIQRRHIIIRNCTIKGAGFVSNQVDIVDEEKKLTWMKSHRRSAGMKDSSGIEQIVGGIIDLEEANPSKNLKRQSHRSFYSGMGVKPFVSPGVNIEKCSPRESTPDENMVSSWISSLKINDESIGGYDRDEVYIMEDEYLESVEEADGMQVFSIFIMLL